jgi:hypothetical protein
MRVVLAADISGTRDGKSWPPRGTELELPDDEAQGLVRNGSAVAHDDPRVASLRGHILTKTELAGAPTGRDITEGQPDTNLSRARALSFEDDARELTRQAAKETELDDEHTVPQALQGPVVGDGEDNPAASAGAADGKPEVADRDASDSAKITQRAGEGKRIPETIESAEDRKSAETATAPAARTPRARG